MHRKSQRAERRGPQAIAVCALARGPTVMALMIGSVVAVMLLALPAFAQAAAPPMPENASPKSYGDGWQCNIGFRLNEDACVAVVVPQNAYDTHRTYGAGWECLHGYRKTDDAACVAVDVPEGGGAPSGEQWRCSRGYIKVDDSCQEILVPEHAYLVVATSGSGWTCELIDVPENAHLDRSGNRWTCNTNFQKSKGRCVLNN